MKRSNIAEAYIHPTGYFRKQNNSWLEYEEKGKKVIHHFDEFSRDENYIYLIDKSRRKDSGRPFLLRLPISGGIAQWSFPNPLDWQDFTIIKKKD